VWSSLLADFVTFHKIRQKTAQAHRTYSGLALRPEDTWKNDHTEDDCQSCSVSARRARQLHHQQCLPAENNQTPADYQRPVNARCTGTARIPTCSGSAAADTFNQKAAKTPSILSPLASASFCYPGGHVVGFPVRSTELQVLLRAMKKANRQGLSANFEEGLAKWSFAKPSSRAR
jgi:hypothetical protein